MSRVRGTDTEAVSFEFAAFPRRARLRAALACALALASAWCAMGGTSGAASGSTVVGATIPSAVTLDDSGCLPTASHDFGNVTPGSSNLTAVCRIDFQSSNDSSMLRLSRANHDLGRPTMVQQSWAFSQQRAATGVSLWDVDAVSDDLAWAVGSNGTILGTTNGGTTWPAQASGVADNLFNIHMVDANVGWAVGDNSRVLRTTNGGTNWTIQTPGGAAANYRDVDALDANTAWVVGSGGAMRRTDDGGATWTVVTGGPTGTATGVAMLSPNTVVVVASTPREIWRTTDRGASWTRVSTAGGCDWGSVDAASPSVLFASGCGNDLARSADGGQTWTVRTDGYNEGDDTVAISPSIAYFTDIFGGVDRTEDGLLTLPFHPTPIVNPDGRVTGLAAAGADTVWTVGDSGTITRSNATAVISDYAAGANWGSGAATSMFGVCVQALGATTVPVWAADTTGVSGTCQANDVDTWRTVPSAPTKIASANTSQQGRIDLVWGMRSASNQPPGRYLAAVTFEALAPNA
jgi:photosystem II stability/assembly factor-like uncharacterized protein